MQVIAYAFYLFAFLAILGSLYCFYRLVATKKERYLLLSLILLLAVYQNTLIATYQLTHFPVLVKILQYVKELIVFGVPLIYFFGHPNIFQKRFRLHTLDYFFIAFGFLALFYVFLPLGASTLVNKMIYFKNMLLWMLLYFVGRNSKLSFSGTKMVLAVILFLGVIAFLFNSAEKILDQHLQSQIGFSSYVRDILEDEPRGNYGLTWTFQATDGTKRFASIFSNPLEFAANMILMFAIAMILFKSSPYLSNKTIYAVMIAISALNALGAYSRASLVGFVGAVFFAAIMLRYYRLLLVAAFVVVSGVVYILYFAPKERLYFVIETITFEQGSSLGHAIEWFQGIESMIESPLGIGMAMSGNAGGVDDDLKVGGENQFIIYGVQLGVPGLLLYTSMVLLGIWYSFKAYRRADSASDAIIPFVAATVKFGLLLPLFTANAETYLFVSLITWWMVGQSIRNLELSILDKRMTPVISKSP